MILYPAGIFQEYKAKIISISCILRTENNLVREMISPRTSVTGCVQYNMQ